MLFTLFYLLLIHVGSQVDENESDGSNSGRMYESNFAWSIASLANVTGMCTWDPIVHAASTSAAPDIVISDAVFILALLSYVALHYCIL